MMSTALHSIVAGGSRAAVIWLLLVVLSIVALVGLALPNGVRRPRQISAWLAENAHRKREAEEQKTAAAAQSIRYAEEIAVAARGAATTAERRRDECQQAQAGVDKAWQAYQDADEVLTRTRQAAAFGTPEAVDEAHRIQSLRRSAQAAYRRGDLSDTQLLDSLTHRNGWDAGRHPVEQELMLARAAVRHRFAAYQRALEVEQEAWRAADIAAASVHSLRKEVTVAATLAESARSVLTPSERTGQRRHRVAAA
jgi:hypothetical protein